MQVRDVMTAGCETCTHDAPAQQVAQMMAKSNFGSVPIERDDKLVGMVTDRDLVIRGVAQGEDLSQKPAAEFMSEQMYYCYDDDECGAVADNMGELQIRRLPVVNREKKLVGIVSLGDLSTRASERDAGDALNEISEPT